MGAWQNLYVSHGLSAFGDRLWQFATPILFITIFPSTLMPSAVFMFALTGAKMVLMPCVGPVIDQTDRLKVVKFGTFGQTFCLCVSTGLLAYMGDPSVRGEHGTGTVLGLFYSATQLGLFVALTAVGIVGDILQAASTIAIEKDWVVCVADEEDPDGKKKFLPQLNSVLRRIDLFCKLCAPMSFGILMGFFEQHSVQEQVLVGSGVVFAWNLLTCLPVYLTWRKVYQSYVTLDRSTDVNGRAQKRARGRVNQCSVFCRGVTNYFKFDAFVASFGFCCLFFTVLSDHHPISTAYMKQHGVSAFWLGVARGGGAVFGIFSTYAFPFLSKRMPLNRVTALSAWGFVLCVGPLGALYVPAVNQAVVGTTTNTTSMGDDLTEGPLRSYVMLVAIVVSRFFLWCFDLGIVQVMQEEVPEDQRGELNAMQNATCQMMEFLMAIVAMVWSSNFAVLVWCSCGGVLSAAVLFGLWAASRSRRAQNDKSAPLLVNAA